MKTFFRLTLSYVVAPVLLYFSILLYLIQSGNDLLLADFKYFFYVPIGISLSFSLLMLLVEYRRIVKVVIPGEKKAVWKSCFVLFGLEAVTVGLLMAGVYFLSERFVARPAELVEINSKTVIPRCLNVHANNVILDKNVLVSKVFEYSPSRKGRRVETSCYRPVAGRADLWVLVHKTVENLKDGETFYGEHPPFKYLSEMLTYRAAEQMAFGGEHTYQVSDPDSAFARKMLDVYNTCHPGKAKPAGQIVVLETRGISDRLDLRADIAIGIVGLGLLIFLLFLFYKIGKDD